MMASRTWRALVALFVVAGALGVPAGRSSAEGRAVGGGAVVVADALNLRGGPGTENPIVDVLASGTTLKLLGGPVDDAWWRVTDGRRVGYVNGNWLAPADPPTDPAGYDVDLGLSYHRQMTRIWCDPADLQTWVEHDAGQALGSDVAVQQRFWDWELSHNDGFTQDQWDAS